MEEKVTNVYQVRNNFLIVFDQEKKEKRMIRLSDIKEINILGGAEAPSLHICLSGEKSVVLTGDTFEQYNIITEAILERTHL